MRCMSLQVKMMSNSETEISHGWRIDKLRVTVGTIDLDLVKKSIEKYKEAYALLFMVEDKLEPILKKYKLEFMFRDDTFEPIWEADEENDELMKFSVVSKNKNDDFSEFIVIKKDGSVVIEKRRTVKIEHEGNMLE